MKHPNDEQLVLYYYAEAVDAACVEEHLGACESCRLAYQNLQRVLNSVDSFPVPERGSDYESRVWHSIQHRLPARGSLAARWFGWKPLAVAGAMAVLVVAAFLAGRTWPKPRTAVSQPIADVSQVRERVLLVAVGDHLERSQMVLIELANAGAPAAAPLDISYEQKTAEDLLDANRLYRQTAAATGDAATATLLEDLERVLLEIAHNPSAVPSGQLREILFKVKVFGTQVEQQERGQGNKL
jgi:hypothetical protein